VSHTPELNDRTDESNCPSSIEKEDEDDSGDDKDDDEVDVPE
jgi:hypothetical protein